MQQLCSAAAAAGGEENPIVGNSQKIQEFKFAIFSKLAFSWGRDSSVQHCGSKYTESGSRVMYFEKTKIKIVS